MIDVFYVTGAAQALGDHSRHDLAKFFRREDADAFVATLTRWHDLRVEVRSEPAEKQHVAHLFTAMKAAPVA